MKKSLLLCGVVFMAVPTLVLAKDFPLAFKTLNAQEAMSFPGGSGAYGTLQPNKPADIRKEPQAISRRPIYGQLSVDKNSMWFRVDESKPGNGYDRLIMDVNQNGDLTDDPVVQRVEEPSRSATTQPEVALFGPIPAPDTKKIGEWRPIYFGQLYLYTQPAGISSSLRGAIVGQMRVRAGWYLEANVELDGVTRKVGIVDGNCNFQLGEPNPPTKYKNGSEENWYFQGGDYFLVDNDDSGKFDNSIGKNESAPFGSILYLGAKPYKAVLAADDKSLALEQWTEPLAELALQPHGQQVNGIQVAWESTPGNWQLLQPGVENGKANVPPGNYRLYTCTIKAQAAGGDTLNLSGYKRTLDGDTKAEAGVSTPFKCGSPLEIKVTTARQMSSAATSSSLLGRVASLFSSSDQQAELRIQASVNGAGGETYSSFYVQNARALRQPPKPAFTVTTADGKQVGSGNMEFG